MCNENRQITHTVFHPVAEQGTKERKITGGGTRSDEGVSAIVHIQHGSIGTFRDNALAFSVCLVYILNAAVMQASVSKTRE
jgi:hypothetical protein